MAAFGFAQIYINESLTKQLLMYNLMGSKLLANTRPHSVTRRIIVNAHL
jgi:hypothetical protein